MASSIRAILSISRKKAGERKALSTEISSKATFLKAFLKEKDVINGITVLNMKDNL